MPSRQSETPQSGSFDQKSYRNALGSFVTGVTVITTTDGANAPVGVTANSFNSVSLDPPLVLWSLAKSARSLSAFASAGHFAVHILHCGQEDLSNRFARKDTDKFANTLWRQGQYGSPLLEDYSTLFECETTHQYDGGDHVIFVGEVKNFEQTDKQPLVFFGGAYAQARRKLTYGAQGEMIHDDQDALTDRFFLFLLGRVYFQAIYPLRQNMREAGFAESEYFIMTLLSLYGALPTSKLCDQLYHLGLESSEDTVHRLFAKKLIMYAPHAETEIAALTLAGKKAFLNFVLRVKEMEEHYLAHFSTDEIDDMKHLLARLKTVTTKEIAAFEDLQQVDRELLR